MDFLNGFERARRFGTWAAIACLVSSPASISLRGANATFAFSEVTIEDVQARFAAGTLTSRQLTQAYLDRIAALNRAGPKLGAVLEVNPDALAIADSLDAERKAGKVRGPLHGIPILIKDNIATADRMETTAGSLALIGEKPKADATIVQRLRDAGAVILGKTNLSEGANFRGAKSNSGWSGRGGFTRNPYVLDRNPSGSSSGSAVAVSANLCVVAIGTETDGSIISPSCHCGVVGLKPTVGLVSRTGIIPISASQDTAGPITRTVGDAAIVLEVLAGKDDADPATRDIPNDFHAEFPTASAIGALKGARVGILRPSGTLRPSQLATLETAIATLRKAGVEIIDKLELKTANEAGKNEREVLLYEFKDGVNAYLATFGPDVAVKNLADVIAFNTRHAAEELAFFGQETLIDAEAKGPLTEEGYLKARADCRRLSRDEGIDALMNEHKLDALLALSNTPAGLRDPVNGDPSTGSTTTLAPVAGYPALTLPAGSVNGLPVGVTWVGRAWSEATLLKFAAEFERLTAARREPRFLNTVDIAGK